LRIRRALEANIAFQPRIGSRIGTTDDSVPLQLQISREQNLRGHEVAGCAGHLAHLAQLVRPPRLERLSHLGSSAEKRAFPIGPLLAVDESMTYETRLRRLFRNLVLCAMPMSAALAGVACGDASSVDSDDNVPRCPPGASGGCGECRVIEKDSWPVEPDGGVPRSLSGTACERYCRPPVDFCQLNEADVTGRTVFCSSSMCSGRRPSGFTARSSAPATNLGGYFAEMAHLEAASIYAFLTLERELMALGAPRALVDMARSAAEDERRHTRVMSALARRHGGSFEVPEVEPTAERSVEAIATENAVEGCVRETFGALLATYQAETARDPLVRTVMARVARDETRHAALAWRVAGWLDQRLDAEARRRVAEAKRSAAIALSMGSRDSRLEDSAALGLPLPSHARLLAGRMLETVWS
jgi:hypothetical protein